MINKRFITIWATVSVAGAFSSQGSSKPLSAALGWAVVGFMAACMDFYSETTKEN
ncbi:MAG: hypothetical protein ACI4OW_04290 [Alphaproteobacteria bacterium]